MPVNYEEINTINSYLKYVKKGKLQKFLLVIPKDYIRSLPDIFILAHRLKKRINKVYVVVPEKSRLTDFLTRNRIEFVESDSEDYYRLLATSRFIYSNDLMDDQFVKREGQIICLNYPLDRIAFGEEYLEYATCRNILADCSNMTEFVSMVRGAKKASKEKLLIMLDGTGYDNYWDDIKKVLKLYEGGDREIYLFATSSLLEKHMDELAMLGPDIHLLIRRSKWLLDKKVKKEFVNLKNSLSWAGIHISDEQKAIPDKILDRLQLETRRLFGTLEFSEVLNFCKTTLYWDFISLLLRPSSLFFYSGGKVLRQERIILLRNKLQDEISDVNMVYLNRAEATTALEAQNEGFREFYYRYLPLDDNSISVEVSEANVNGRDVLICGEQAMELPGVTQFDIAPAVKTGTAAYIVTDNAMGSEDWDRFLEIVRRREPQLHVYDYFNIFKDYTDEDDLLSKKRVFKALQDRYSKCIWYVNSDENIMREAKEHDIEVLALDINGNPAEYIDEGKNKAESIPQCFMLDYR